MNLEETISAVAELGERAQNSSAALDVHLSTGGATRMKHKGKRNELHRLRQVLLDFCHQSKQAREQFAEVTRHATSRQQLHKIKRVITRTA